MLNLRLPACRPMPSSTIIMEPEYGIYFEDGQGELRFQRATDIPKAPTQSHQPSDYCSKRSKSSSALHVQQNHTT